MSKDVLRYDLMVQEALKGVVRKILTEAARDGLPGEHHFYITFRTGAPGVRLSQRLREKHPDEMTIVLQHQFWDLSVSDHAFEVGLSFSGVPERLLIPFDAVTTFFDPSVQFGLKFETQGEPEEVDAPQPESVAAPASVPTKVVPAGVPALKTRASAAEASDKGSDATISETDDDGKSGAEVVSLDSFRKKT
ncbi:hypothetical protein FQV39_28310 [Bosea sp. F3-2]|uniref:SspB family protein n=1 Tax=Bosea sp. F3-2 TaxID=2599640 RepID=UPI0011ED9E49|nr:SspB family protein [Bosea sp. F3-2]QEL26074.1 hypothetical protein FQV39_28310 [Bosea sp. F3-2]